VKQRLAAGTPCTALVTVTNPVFDPASGSNSQADLLADFHEERSVAAFQGDAIQFAHNGRKNSAIGSIKGEKNLPGETSFVAFAGVFFSSNPDTYWLKKLATCLRASEMAGG